MLSFFGLLFSGKVSCENTSVSGRVYDQNNHSLSFASVALKNSSDSTLVKVALTDETGEYRFDDLEEGRYFLEISMLGHKDASRKFGIEDGEEKEIKPFLLDNANKNNAEGTHPLLLSFSGKIVLDAEGNGVKLTGNAWDVLKTLPNISENEDGLLVCNGKTRFILEIDGKKTDLSGSAMRNRIKQIKAAEIAGIELNTNSGTIVNIITIEGTKNGFYGKAEAGGEYGKNFRTADAFEFNYHKGNLDFYGRYDFSQKKSTEETFLQESFISNEVNIDYKSKSVSVEKPVDHEAVVGIDYKGDKGLNFGASITKENVRNAGIETDKSMYTVIDPADTLMFLRTYTTNSNDKIQSLDFYADKTFKKIGTKFSSTFSIAKDHDSWNQAFPIEEESGVANIPATNFYRFAGGSELHVVKGTLKYAQAWNSTLITVLGVRKTLITNGSKFGIEKLENQTWMDQGILNEAFNYKQEINSAFAVSYLDFGKIQIAASVDAQQSIMSGVNAANETVKHKSHIQFIPSVSIDQKLNKNNAINYSFSQDIKRPSFRDLDPTNRYVNSYTYEAGNPLLQPEITNEAKVTWTFLELFSVAGGVDYTKNGIQRVTRVDANGNLFHTKENITNEKNATLEVFCPLPIGKNIVISNKLVWTWSDYQSEVYGMSINSNNHHFAGASAIQVKLPANFVFNVNGYYVSPTSNGIVTTKSVGELNASITKTMLHKSLEIELGITDILNTGNVSATILTQDGMVNYKSKSETQMLTLKASYSFGNQKAVRK